MITWIDAESKREHIGPSPWKRASKSTISRILAERAAQWGQTKKVTPKPLYRAVAHVSFRNFLCNAACLHHVHNPLSPHKAALSNTDQFKIVITNAGFEVLFFDRSEAALPTLYTRKRREGTGRASIAACCLHAPCMAGTWLVPGWLTLAAWQSLSY
jgi:hypothetical protein